jgi:hypothetical protein
MCIPQDLLHPDASLMLLMYKIGRNCLQAYVSYPTTLGPNNTFNLDQYCNFTSSDYRCFADNQDGCNFSSHETVQDYFDDLTYVDNAAALDPDSKRIFYVAILFDFLAFVSEQVSKYIKIHGTATESNMRELLQLDITKCFGLFGDNAMISVFRAAVHQTPPSMAYDHSPIDTPHTSQRFELHYGDIDHNLSKRPRCLFENEVELIEQPSEDYAVHRSMEQPSVTSAVNQSPRYFMDLELLDRPILIEYVDLTASTPPRLPSASLATFTTPGTSRFSFKFSPNARTPTSDNLKIFNVSSLKRMDNSSVVIFDTGASRSGTGHKGLLENLQP